VRPDPVAVASVVAGVDAASLPAPGAQPSWLLPACLVLALGTAGSIWLGVSARDRVSSLEQELVRRQQGSAEQAAEAHLMAKQAQELTQDATAKVTLLEARLSEVALQRSQLEELMQSLSRSRDENMVTDVDAGIRVALQQTSITGSAEPLVAALRSADERLARAAQPRLDGVRRAVARDLDRVRAVGVPDINSLLIKLDEVVRLADDLPLVSNAQASRAPAARRVEPAAKSASGAASAPPAQASVWQRWLDDWSLPLSTVWEGVSSLLRVTRIDRPEAMLISPEQGFFLRENLKLRLLNARLALLSRQPEMARADLVSAEQAVQRYFDISARRTQVAVDLIRQVSGQARQAVVPRPDETLAALAAVAAVAGR
jgi:uroporphyrin-3 C-methyltransferase